MTEISELEASTKRTTDPSKSNGSEKALATMTTDTEAKREDPVAYSKPVDDYDSEAEEEEDDFDLAAIKEPRLSSSTVPIVVEVSNSHKTARFYTNDADPLFQGVCLYSTTSSSTTKESSTSKVFMPRSDTPSDSPESLDLWDQWYMPSVFRYLWQRGSGWTSKRTIQMDSE